MFYEASWFAIAPFLRVVFRAKFDGQAHIPKKGPAILASNHLSFLDHPILGAATRRQIVYISKAQHFDRPVRSFLFRKWGVIPLKRGEGDQEAFQRSIEVLREGHLYCIYPEGTRSLDGKLHKGHTGVARLAAITKAPVIPVAMWGTFEAYPKGAKRPKLVPCGVKFGAPLDFSHLHGLDGDRIAMRAATDEVMQAIQKLSGQQFVNEYQFNPEVKTHAKVGG
ncbi:MAG TPA: lysophospholipid acyltransferase family protein [Candidatus Thermoplasmatota archaeon]